MDPKLTEKDGLQAANEAATADFDQDILVPTRAPAPVVEAAAQRALNADANVENAPNTLSVSAEVDEAAEPPTDCDNTSVCANDSSAASEETPSAYNGEEMTADTEGESDVFALEEEEEPSDAASKKKKKSLEERYPILRKIPTNTGLIESICKKFESNPKKQKGLRLLYAVLFSIALFFALVLATAIYAVGVLAALFVSLVLMLICLVLVVLALVCLGYGIVLIFTQGPLPGLIEIGLALILYAMILALTALAGELATGKLLKHYTSLFMFVVFLSLSLVFGTRVFRRTDKMQEVVAQ